MIENVSSSINKTVFIEKTALCATHYFIFMSYGILNICVKELLDELKVTDRRLIVRTKNTGAWMNVWGTMVTGIVLLAMEFCVFL